MSSIIAQLKDLQSLGCTDDAVTAATFRTYLDLCEVRKYDSISYHLKPELNRLYLIGQKTADSDPETIIPILAGKMFTFDELANYQSAFNTNSIKLAICDSSSIIMYYKLSKS